MIKSRLFRTFSLNIEVYSIFYMLYTLLAFNCVFFEKIFELSQSLLFTIGTFFVIWLLLTICGILLFWKWSVKPLSILFLLINSGVFYFVKNYHAAIDEEMLRNVLETNMHETAELLNFTWLSYILLLGGIPSLIIWRIKFSEEKRFKHRIIVFAAAFLAISAIIIPNSKDVAQFVRNNKPAKYLLIPVNYIGAISSTIKHNMRANHKFVTIGLDSHFTKYWNNDNPLILVFVVGETARSANFSLDGYNRDTNAPLNPHSHNIINYTNMFSCGTSTAVSVPCMFSKDARTEFDNGSSYYTENVLDIFQKNGWQVVWLENNSDCKGVCTRVKTIKPCPTAAGTCLDSVLTQELVKQLDNLKQNTLIVLHQAGSHGPTYYKRYPQEFSRFAPVCNTEKLNKCSAEEIVNTYDNTILYTSQNLADIISILQKKPEYNSMLFYVSDHGESLGEYNVYLHSAPYRIAPQEQKHIPFFIWADDSSFQNLNLDKQCLESAKNKKISHDNLFHTLLSIGGISTSEYKQQLDLTAKCKKIKQN